MKSQSSKNPIMYVFQTMCAVALFSAASFSFACDVPKAAGVLKSKDHIVELYSSDHGPVYTVKSLAGVVLAESISEDEVLGQFPQLQHIVKGVADDASIVKPNTRERYDILGTKLGTK